MPAKHDDDTDSLKSEIAKLKNEIASLKAGKKNSRSSDDDDNYNDVVKEFSKTVADTNRQVGDEVTRLIRSYSDATAEYFSGVANLAGVFNDELNKRTQDDDDDDGIKNLANLPNHIHWAYLEALKQSAKIPGAVIDTFNEAYQDADKSANT